MKQKLIKISEDYYIVVNDSEIKEGDYYIDDANTIRRSVTSDKDYWSSRVDYKKITHSTKSMYEGRVMKKGVIDNVKAISLSEVKEALGIENKALEFANQIFAYEDYDKGQWQGRLEGFNKAMELTKDKLFTLEDVLNAYELGIYDSDDARLFGTEKVLNRFKSKIVQSTLPKTEWEATFDENNKLKVI